MPGVMAAGASTAPPLGGHWGQFFDVEGEPPRGPNEKSPIVLQVAVTPEYFDAIGMTLIGIRPSAISGAVSCSPSGSLLRRAQSREVVPFQ